MAEFLYQNRLGPGGSAAVERIIAVRWAHEDDAACVRRLQKGRERLRDLNRRVETVEGGCAPGSLSRSVTRECEGWETRPIRGQRLNGI
jgi:hypothetical protein